MDPQEPFWNAPLSTANRLVFADWCQENGLPVMEAVQRWLAATRRSPIKVADGYKWELGSGHPCRLPHALFSRLRRTTYPTRRAAEEALAVAWEKATRRRWFRWAWVPDYTPVIGAWS